MAHALRYLKPWIHGDKTSCLIFSDSSGRVNGTCVRNVWLAHDEHKVAERREPLAACAIYRSDGMRRYSPMILFVLPGGLQTVSWANLRSTFSPA